MTARVSYWWLPMLGHYKVTSEATLEYNCFAWALGDDSRWVDPIADYAYWPEGIPNENTIDSVTELFREAGYKPCDDGRLETGYEKIVIYARNGEPLHAARQLSNGQWTSKLGKYQDIVHSTPEELQGDYDYSYGRVAKFMARPRSDC